jgi:hypothetical protein
MKRQLTLLLGLAVLGTVPLLAQHGADPSARHDRVRANQGHIPPAPPARGPRGVAPEAERFDGGRMNSLPHVNHDRWYGHDVPGDPRFRVAAPFPHGRFVHLGPAFRYNVLRVDRDHHRFWLPGGFFFEVADVDWPLSADWCWDCGDDFVVYEDPDHPGWYLVYNVQTGQYIHARYMGP